MLWHEWVVLIAVSTGSALRAVRPPNLHITPVVRRDFVYRASAKGSLYRSPLAIGRRHQPHRVTQRLELARPVVSRRAGLDTDQTWRQLLEESQYIATLQLPANNHRAASVNAVNLENRLGDI